MAAYHAETDIERLLQTSFTDNTECKSADVTIIIDQTDVEIDSKLKDKYIVPITGTRALTRIKAIATKISAGTIQEMYGSNYLRAVDKETGDRIPRLLGEGRRELNDLVIGKTSLIFTEDGATAASHARVGQKVAGSFNEGVTQSPMTDFDVDLSKDHY